MDLYTTFEGQMYKKPVVNTLLSGSGIGVGDEAGNRGTIYKYNSRLIRVCQRRKLPTNPKQEREIEEKRDG